MENNPGAFAAYLYFLPVTQLGEHCSHTLPLGIPNGPESISGIGANDEARNVGGDKAQSGTAC
jgi:hypothetical protein